MKASEARTQYFEDYVEFEHKIRKLIKVYKKQLSTKDLSLSDVLDNLSTEISNDHRIKISTLKKHKNTRNWLAHQARSTEVPEKFIKNMEEIKEVNMALDYLIKNPHP